MAARLALGKPRHLTLPPWNQRERDRHSINVAKIYGGDILAITYFTALSSCHQNPEVVQCK